MVSGIGGLGMQGCEYGLHPDTFSARLDSFLRFRETVLLNTGIVSSKKKVKKEVRVAIQDSFDVSAVDIHSKGAADHDDDDDDDDDADGQHISSEFPHFDVVDRPSVRVLLVQRPDQRKFTNLKEMIANIQSTKVSCSLDRLSSEAVVVEVVEFSELSLVQQVNVSFHADILVAVDGTVQANKHIYLFIYIINS
jgi:hypothetical protein